MLSLIKGMPSEIQTFVDQDDEILVRFVQRREILRDSEKIEAGSGVVFRRRSIVTSSEL